MKSSSASVSPGCVTTSPIERVIRRIAGVFVMVSLALGYFVHPGWFGFTAFVGFNLFQSSFTGFCPMEKLLEKMGVGNSEPSGSHL